MHILGTGGSTAESRSEVTACLPLSAVAACHCALDPTRDPRCYAHSGDRGEHCCVKSAVAGGHCGKRSGHFAEIVTAN
jgi:hypothetical protein